MIYYLSTCSADEYSLNNVHLMLNNDLLHISVMLLLPEGFSLTKRIMVVQRIMVGWPFMTLDHTVNMRMRWNILILRTCPTTHLRTGKKEVNTSP